LSKIKIFYVITKTFWGGAQRYVFDLATHIPTDKFDPMVVAGGKGELMESLAQKKVKTTSIPLSNRFDPLGDIKTFLRLLAFLKKERPAIIHLNSSKIGFLGGLAGRISGVKKIIFTAHGWPFNEDRPWIVRKIFLVLCWLIAGLAHKIICVSQAVKNDARYFPFTDKNKFTVIYNGIEPIKFFDRRKAREILSNNFKSVSNENAFWIGAASELTKNKGILYLIKALNSLRAKNYLCVVIGEGKLRKLIEEKITNLGLNHKIKLVGRISGAAQLLKAFDIFVMPSLTEAFPYSLLEAGMTSLPVVASHVGGIPEVIENEKSGLLVTAKNTKELAQAISQLISEPKKGASYGESLYKQVSMRFPIEKMLRETLSLYEE